MKITDLPKHLRPREKLIEFGVETLKDRELIAILIRTGRRGLNAVELAQKILKKYPTSGLLDTSFEDLIRLKGVDKSKAASVVASLELAKRITKAYSKNQPFVEKPEDVIRHTSHLSQLKKEHFVVLYLNARNQLIRLETISIGTLTASLVHPREVFAPALEIRAAAIILVHNHPSGDCHPSAEDVSLTERLCEAGQLLAIDVLDHIILGNQDYLSMKQLRLI